MTSVPTTLLSTVRFIAAMHTVRRQYPALWRWAIGNQWRKFTVGLERDLRRSGQSAAPRSLTLRPIFLCNARCQMCTYAHSIDPETERPVTAQSTMLDVAIALRLADALATSHSMIHVTGGEPLLWGDSLYTFLAHCRRVGVPTSVTTNGILLERHLDRMLANPPDVLVLSMHGPQAIHEQIIGLPAFSSIGNALSALQEAKQGDPFRPPLLITNTVVLPQNTPCLAEVVRLARGWGAVAASFQPLWHTTEEMRERHHAHVGAYDDRYTAQHNVDTVRMQPGAIWDALCAVKAEGQLVGMPIHVYPHLRAADIETYYARPESPVIRTRARCAYLIGQVLPDGTVTPCLGHAVGNLHTEDFPAIWNGAAMRAFRQQLSRQRLLPICTRCCVLWRDA